MTIVMQIWCNGGGFSADVLLLFVFSYIRNVFQPFPIFIRSICTVLFHRRTLAISYTPSPVPHLILSYSHSDLLPTEPIGSNFCPIINKNTQVLCPKNNGTFLYVIWLKGSHHLPQSMPSLPMPYMLWQYKLLTVCYGAFDIIGKLMNILYSICLAVFLISRNDGWNVVRLVSTEFHVHDDVMKWK